MRFKGSIFFLCLLALFSLLNKALGQAIVNPSLSAEQVCQSSQSTNTVNCDMLTGAGTDRIFAITWDNNNQAYIKVFHQTDILQSQVVTLPQGAAQPDIAIANDLNSPGDYKIAVAYQLESDVHLGVYSVTGISAGTLNVQLSGSYKLNTLAASHPHLDMLADKGNLVDGNPSMHKFGVTWSEFDASVNDISVQARVADIATPTNYTWNVYIPQATNPDVAAYVNAATGKEFLCVLYTKPNSVNGTGSDLRVLETEIDGSVNLFHFLEKGRNFASGRIECQAFYNPGTSKWAAVAATGTGNPGSYAINMYDDAKTGADISTPLGAYNNNNPAIAAGTGNDNQPYAAVFYPLYDSSLYFTSASQWNATWGNNYYEVNHTAMDIHSGMPAVAVSSASNTGNGHLIAWFNGHDVVYKIINDDVRSADPTTINQVKTGSAITLYPNPATDVLNIAGSKATAYTVTDMAGAQVISGSFGRDHASINISDLSGGMYLLQLADGSLPLRFIKQ